MSIVSQKIPVENRLALTVENFLKKFSTGSILKEANAYKEKGTPCVQVFRMFLSCFYLLVFLA